MLAFVTSPFLLIALKLPLLRLLEVSPALVSLAQLPS
jgi:hypothetical protein